MKRILPILMLIFLAFQSNAQLLKLQSADSLNGKPKKEFYTTAWVKFSAFYDMRGIPNVSAMHLPSIPTERENIQDDPQYHADMNQTRLIFATRFQTKSLGEIMSYIETDFYGGDGGGGLRLRHAYLRVKNFKIGQTWSGFTDEEAWPNITDFDGPSTGAWVRSTQLTYFIRPNKNSDISIGMEVPTIDYGRYLLIDTLVTPTNQTLPDFVSHYELRWPTGHFQIAGVARAIEYKNAGNSQYVFGGGFSASGSQILFGRDKFIYQAAYGYGISRYLVSFGGGGWDAVPNTHGDLKLVPIYGGYIGYQYYWGKKNYDKRENNHFSSTVVYGYVQLDNPLSVPASTLLTGSYASANLYWHVVGPLNIAVEGIYGFRTDEFESAGDNLRIQGVVEYNF
tara:strand:- start:19710 stop:20894 length:1185 start_codon:yes stop_codon:yes gene_type:complete